MALSLGKPGLCIVALRERMGPNDQSQARPGVPRVPRLALARKLCSSAQHLFRHCPTGWNSPIRPGVCWARPRSSEMGEEELHGTVFVLAQSLLQDLWCLDQQRASKQGQACGWCAAVQYNDPKARVAPKQRLNGRCCVCELVFTAHASGDKDNRSGATKRNGGCCSQNCVDIAKAR